MSKAVREIEDKYDVDEVFTLPDLVGIGPVASVGEPTKYTLDATYFDTADLRLALASMTLRRRVGGDDEGWHLKLPGKSGARTEIRRPPGRAVRTVPAPLRRLVRSVSQDADLEPVVRLRTERTVRKLYDAEGVELAEVADDRVTGEEMGSVATVTTWREVEVELSDGQRDLLAEVAPRLRDAGARPATHPSKLSRVLGGRLRARRPEPPADAGSAGAVVWAALRGQVDRLRGYDPRVRQDEPDSVHQMRVATRTLRSLLRAYRPLLDRSVTDPIRDELKWLGGLLGEARDAEVMAARLGALIKAEPAEQVLGPVAARVKSVQHHRYQEAHAALIEGLDGTRYLALLDSLADLLRDPPWTAAAAKPAKKVLPRRVGKTWRTLRGAVAASEVELTDTERDLALHEVRKAAKQARYTASAVAGPDAAAFTKRMKGLQTVLGDHQDTVVSRQLLRSLSVSAMQAGENGFTYGLLYGVEEQHAAQMRKEFETQWADASRKSNLRWLT